jgi:hypothetical protein
MHGAVQSIEQTALGIDMNIGEEKLEIAQRDSAKAAIAAQRDDNGIEQLLDQVRRLMSAAPERFKFIAQGRRVAAPIGMSHWADGILRKHGAQSELPGEAADADKQLVGISGRQKRLAGFFKPRVLHKQHRQLHRLRSQFIANLIGGRRLMRIPADRITGEFADSAGNFLQRRDR